MDPCGALAEKLAAHPSLQWNERADGIRIEAPDPEGFAVELRREGRLWAVYLGSGAFHQRFEDGDAALNFVAWCYSGDARLREIWWGRPVQKAILEARADGRWQEESVTGYFLVPFWRARRERILVNPNLLSAG